MEPTCSQDAIKWITTQIIAISTAKKKRFRKTLPSFERPVNGVAERELITQNCEWKKKNCINKIKFMYNSVQLGTAKYLFSSFPIGNGLKQRLPYHN